MSEHGDTIVEEDTVVDEAPHLKRRTFALALVPVWISGPQFEAWKHTQLVIDLVPGRGGGFSLEAPEGFRFLSRGRTFTDDENRMLADDPPLTGADYERGARPASSGTRIVAEAVDACPIPAGRAAREQA